MGGTVDRAEKDQVERVINHNLKERFCDVAYAEALRHVLALDDVPPHIADQARDTLAKLESAEAEVRP
jgi:hypothetical protein